VKLLNSIATIAFSTSVLATPIAINPLQPLPAQASTQTVVEELKGAGDLVNMIWGWGGSSVFRQTYFGHLGDANTLNKQYGSQSNNVAINQCIQGWNLVYLTPSGRGWLGFANYTTNKWQFATRIENGKYNCFIRLPNNASKRFDELMRR
jgi:hypothetical protein